MPLDENNVLPFKPVAASATLTFDDLGQSAPAAVVTLHDNMITALRKAYPQWANSWHIVIDVNGGIVQVRNTAISGKMGFVMHIAQIDPEMRKVVRNAGELFERYHIARKRGTDIREAIATLKRTGTREPIYED